MIRSGNWQRIERLPERPGVVVYTSTGYYRDGVFYPAHRARPPRVEQPRRGLLARVMGR